MSDYRRPVDELPVKNEGALSLTDTLIGVDAVAEPAAFQAQLGEIAARLVGPIADDLPSDAGFIDALISSILGPDAAGIEPFYETGSFEPVLYATSSNPTVTYATRTGNFIRIGNFVHVEIQLGTTGHSGGSGNARIGALPYYSETPAVSRNVVASGLPMPGAAWGLYGFANQTSTGLRIFRPTDGGSINEMTISQWPSNSSASMTASLTYIRHNP